MLHRHRWTLARWDYVPALGRFPVVCTLTWRCDRCGRCSYETRPV